MFNQTTMIGRLTRDAQMGTCGSDHARATRVCFTLAVDRDYDLDGETPTDFWPCEIAGLDAPRLLPYLVKGRLVLVTGQAHLDERRTEAGVYQVLPCIRVRQVRFLDRRPPQPAGDA